VTDLARLRRTLAALALGCLGLLGLAGATPNRQSESLDPVASLPLQVFDQAWTAERPYGKPNRNAMVAAGSLADVPLPQDAGAWQMLKLPAVVPAEPGLDAAARAQVKVRWLRVAYEIPRGAAGPMALYLPRVEGASVQVAVFDGSNWRVVWDGSDRWREQWNRPVIVDLGDAPEAGQSLQVAVGLMHFAGHEMGVTRLQIGPRQALHALASWREVLQLTAPQVGSLTFLTLGCFALAYWRGRRAEHAYLLFFLSSLAWWMGNLHYYSPMPTDLDAYHWFWWMTDASLSWTMLTVYLFTLRFDHRRSPRVERALLIFVGAMSVLTMPLASLPWHTQVQQHTVNLVVAVLVVSWLSALAWRGATREFRVITVALWGTDLLGVHDLLMVANVLPPDSIYMLPFASSMLFLAFLYAVQIRYSQAIAEVEQLNSSLERKLAEREHEVRVNHERISGIEREQALLLERQRLMRDMHDGLGSTLMSSLVLVEQGKLDSPAVAELLRECVDDLRLVIDSLEPMGQDLVTLLASLRHRLGRRLEGAGLKMHWDVEDLPPLEWLQPHDALQVMRIVQEVLTNVLKHAQAATVRLATRAHHESVTVLIEDDGAGFDTTQDMRGRGVRHLYQRAGRLGGRIILDSAQGQGTRVRLELPLQRKPVA
jgi:signal transduction histidine kinase